MVWGYELTLDFHECNHEKLKSADNIQEWVDCLVNAIGMVKYGPLSLNHFANHDPNAAGYTAVQLIETSSITAHFAENIGKVFINIFSCKEFDPFIAESITRMFFQPRMVKNKFMKRGDICTASMSRSYCDSFGEAA